MDDHTKQLAQRAGRRIAIIRDTAIDLKYAIGDAERTGNSWLADQLTRTRAELVREIARDDRESRALIEELKGREP